MEIKCEELSEEEKRRIQDCFDPVSMFRDMVRVGNGLVMPRLYVEDPGKK